MVDAITLQSAVVPVVDGGQKILYVPGFKDVVGCVNHVAGFCPVLTQPWQGVAKVTN